MANMNQTITISKNNQRMETSHYSYSHSQSQSQLSQLQQPTLTSSQILQKTITNWVKENSAKVNKEKLQHGQIEKKIEDDHEILKKKKEDLLAKIAEQEKRTLELKEKLKTKTAELERMIIEHNEDIEVKKAKIREFNKSNAELAVEIRENSDTIRMHANFMAFFNINYKEDPGNCLCPENKVCSSSKGTPIECDYWNCPKVSNSNTVLDVQDKN